MIKEIDLVYLQGFDHHIVNSQQTILEKQGNLEHCSQTVNEVHLHTKIKN